MEIEILNPIHPGFYESILTPYGFEEQEYESDDSDDSGVITCWDCNGTGDIKSKNFEDYYFDSSKFDSYEKSYHDWIKLFQIIVDHYEEIKLKSFDVKLLR